MEGDSVRWVTTRLSPEQFIAMLDISPEWSLAASDGELVLYTRHTADGRIYQFLGPNSFGYTQRELITFAYKVKYAIRRARRKS